MANTTPQLTINGITYDVLAVDTLEQIEARGLTNLAAMFKAEGRTRQLTLRRPNGKRTFLGIEWAHQLGFTYRVVPMAF